MLTILCRAAWTFAAVGFLCTLGCGAGYTVYGQPIGNAGHVVILLHGYGAPGDDLRGLAIDLKHFGAPPDSAYVMAEGPVSSGGGRAWFSNNVDAPKAVAHVQNLIRTLTKKARLPAEKVALVGFSQGALVAMEVALQSATPLGRVVAISSPALLNPPRQGSAKGTSFSVIHGESDGVVSPDAARTTVQQLSSAGLRVDALFHPGGHQIPLEARTAAGKFLSDW